MDTNARADIAVVGLGVMGRNLALNFADHGFRVAVYDPFPEVLEKARETLRDLVVCESPEDMVKVLTKPARILIMIKAGKPVDDVIDSFAPILAPDDILIDGGNTFYRDTERRQEKLKAKGLKFVGLGVSGGEEGARFGPALMAGGDADALAAIEAPFSAIAAKAADGASCYAAHGPMGAGHFVKMVHNGIEYGLMQMLAECYLLLSGPAEQDHKEISDCFGVMNAGPAASYLAEISQKVMATIDPETGRPLVELIRDQAAHKGTGRWTVEAGLEYGIAVPSVAAGFLARALSGRERLTGSKRTLPLSTDATGNLPDLAIKAFPAAMLSVYVQGLELIAEAARDNGWDTDLSSVARGWRAGCIIRSAMLDPLSDACKEGDALASPFAEATLEDAEAALRAIVTTAALTATPTPALSSALSWLDGRRSACLGANFIQGQRDYFGAHTFERVDREGHFHHDWMGEN
ncbi:6-phosphogluconate dehydrogenase [Cohaesibacter sp. ES.047]|uniref:NADP-dependent phosphogluconate dehydrogenase n=1 Tax=Cohaesibacter sp. ES.047 TaxID=1798205 RepID=UPI000BC0C82B|nr:NADP-dependent phosphogluconate dehydrogenase [Cohaesibacter sp. ES.047]SNY89960.1 6-phosphogluconate dehydrogenase [Cohaesibacter sp. ES.047]